MSSRHSDEEFERRIRNVLHDRSLIVPPQADALERIHTGARRRQQRRSATAVLGAVAVMGIAAAAVGLRAQSHSSNVAAVHTPSPSLSSASPAQTSSPVASADAKPFPSTAVVVPSGSPAVSAPPTNVFSPVSVSAISVNEYWVLLGGSECNCMTLKMTADGGHSFTTLQAPAGVGAKGWIADTIRFGNASEGWAFGDNGSPSLFATTDGGRSWSQVSQFAGHVDDIVAANGKAWALVDTTPPNSTVRAQFALYVTSYGQAPEVWTRVSIPVDLGSTIPSIVDQDGTVTVLASGPTRTDNKSHVLIGAPGKPFTDHIGPCEQDLGGYLSNSATGVWAVCPTGHMAGLSVSTDRGATWKSVTDLPSPSLPDPGRGGIGAVDATHAFVYDLATTSLVLITVGSPPAEVTAGPTSVGAGTVFIGFTTRSIGFSVVTGQDAATKLWRTTDGGQTWAVVAF